MEQEIHLGQGPWGSRTSNEDNKEREHKGLKSKEIAPSFSFIFTKTESKKKGGGEVRVQFGAVEGEEHWTTGIDGR